jgi:hypothetical protein
MTQRFEIACQSTGYHMLERRKVSLAIVDGRLELHERGETRTIGREGCRPIEWVGQGKMAPMVPLYGVVLEAPGGPWIVSTIDTTVVLDGATTQASPAPQVWVAGEDLALLAAACQISVQRRAPLVMPTTSPKSWWVGAGLVGVCMIGATIYGLNKSPSASTSCEDQRPPEQELYPRLSCADARAELDRVARGEASPRAIVLRPTALTVDARDVTGPGTILCDGLEFSVVDAQQADPNGPLVFNPGPHAVLVAEQADGTLQVSQYCICCNVVRGERSRR